MKIIALKTNINCGGCVASVTPFLNETVGENNWKVDTQNPDKVLTVNGNTLTEQQVIQVVKKAGFTAQRVNS